eukprot:5843878-Prymnesium_polylepis.3
MLLSSAKRAPTRLSSAGGTDGPYAFSSASSEAASGLSSTWAAQRERKSALVSCSTHWGFPWASWALRNNVLPLQFEAIRRPQSGHARAQAARHHSTMRACRARGTRARPHSRKKSLCPKRGSPAGWRARLHGSQTPSEARRRVVVVARHPGRAPCDHDEATAQTGQSIARVSAA